MVDLSGISGYLKVQGIIETFFPIDKKGNAIINCFHCPYLASNERTCQLLKQPVAFPNKYISQNCPFYDSVLQELESEGNENV